MRHSLSCACATNCFAHAHTIALCMFAQLLCACPIYTSHRHAHAIALHMRKPLLCTCASHYFAHARPIALHMRAPLYRARPQFANMHPGVHVCWRGEISCFLKKLHVLFFFGWNDYNTMAWFKVSQLPFLQ